MEVDRRDTDLPCASSGEVNLSSKAVSQLHKNRLRPSTGENDQESEYKLENFMIGPLLAISKMLELHDPYTAGHEKRVGIVARDIAIEMGWSEGRAKLLELIGLVHDVGKIALPIEILTKPTRLSPIEMELVRTHTDAGYEILKNLTFPVPLAEIVREHHERLDGSGYPHKLKGDQILLEARIIAVADVLESMATQRPYRKALGIEAALEELTKNRGTLYDSEVVDAITRLFRDKAYQLPAY